MKSWFSCYHKLLLYHPVTNVLLFVIMKNYKTSYFVHDNRRMITYKLVIQKWCKLLNNNTSNTHTSENILGILHPLLLGILHPLLLGILHPLLLGILHPLLSCTK